MDREQEVRERAYKIWEDEGRVDGMHDDHWARAERQHEQTERQAEEANKERTQADSAVVT